MKKINVQAAVSLLAMIFLFACSEDKYMGDYDYLNPNIEISVTFDEEAFVSLELATDVAKAFLSKEAKNGAKSFASASVEAVNDKSSNPAFYIVNYPEGGWVIVGATKNYYPVLAYNDEGSFELRPEAEMGGVVVWLEETKEAVRVSAAFADTTKAQMRNAWKVYEANDKKIPSGSGAKNYQIMYARMEQLAAIYGGSSGAAGGGWNTYNTLQSMQGLLQYNEYQNLLYYAQMFGSDPDLTIVAMKDQYYTTTNVGPLLTTQWHQDAPFNASVQLVVDNNGNLVRAKAGCVAVAIAQIMKYHKYSYNFNFSFNWNLMPDIGQNTNPATHHTPDFIYDVGQAADTNYGYDESYSTDQNAYNVLKNTHGYDVGNSNNPDDHDVAKVRTNILAKRPVYVSGQIGNNPNDPGHAWVCDGVRDSHVDKIYFIEFFTGSGYSDNGFITPSYPGSIHQSSNTHFHLNWGESPAVTGGYNANGWYINNSFPYGASNFSFKRKNIYVKCGKHSNTNPCNNCK